MLAKFFLTGLCLVWISEVQAQTTKQYQPVRTNTTIKLDGKLTEPAWQNAGIIDQFMQAQPTPGKHPSEITIAKIVYDNDNIYIGVLAKDQDPGKLISNNLVRDKWYSNDDGISVMLDTYNDKANAVIFYTNLEGARVDAEIIGNEGNTNQSWNTFWDVATGRDNEGYSVEFRIPFSSLRFERKDQVIMSFRIIRQIGRKNELVIYPVSEINVPNIVWRVNTSSEIVFSGLNAKKPVYFAPYINMNYVQSNIYNGTSNKFDNKKQFLQRNYFSKSPAFDRVLSSFGADVKLGLSKNLTLDLTANTDFAHAEVDNRIINMTRFSVNLPEKRNFFLESANYLNYTFSSGDLLFNSRNIGISDGKIIPIIGGIRLTGKIKKLQVGILNMQTNGLLPDSVNAENFSIVRFRRELKNNGSFIGGIFTNRMSTAGGNNANQVVGLDYYQRSGDLWSYGINIAGSKDQDQNFDNDNLIYNIYAGKNVDRGFAHFATFTSSGKDFNPASGFVSDRGYTEIFLSNAYYRYLANTGNLNRLALISLTGKKWRQADLLYPESAFISLLGRAYYKNGFSFFLRGNLKKDSLAYDWNFSSAFRIPIDQYNLSSFQAYMISDATKKLLYDIEAEYGHFYGGKKLQLNPNIVWNMNKHFRFVIDYYYVLINFPSSHRLAAISNYVNHLAIATIYYSYSVKWSFKGIVQYDNQTKTVGANLKLRYNPREGTDLYLVYSPIYNTVLERMNPHLPLVNNQAVILKFTKTFNINK